MAEKDIVEKILEDYPEVFADIVNVLLFDGTNVIEIAKDREAGIQDEFIPLWYEMESRRMLNEQTEVIKYKWTTEWAEQEAEEDFMPVDDEEDIPWR